MWEKLTDLVETVTSRRTFIGRAALRTTTLISAVLSFTRNAAAGNCTCGSQELCCCLFAPHDSNCKNHCEAQGSGRCSWQWPCGPWQGQCYICYECFYLGGTCDNKCQNHLFVDCSQHIPDACP
jgi:hypothetical protein